LPKIGAIRDDHFYRGERLRRFAHSERNRRNEDAPKLTREGAAAAHVATQLQISAMSGTLPLKSGLWQEAPLRNLPAALFFSTALVSWLGSAEPASSEQRSGAGPCRQGVLALAGMIDDGDLKSADYRHAFSGVVGTCGPISKLKAAPKSGRSGTVQRTRGQNARRNRRRPPERKSIRPGQGRIRAGLRAALT